MFIPDFIPTPPPVCILFALPDEAKPFQAAVKAQQERALPIAVTVSGAGARNAALGAKALYTSHALCLLICGFAGGLTSELSAGMLVFGEQVTNSTGEVLKADSRLLTVAESVRSLDLCAMRGAIYTGDKVFGSSVEKQELAGQTHAVAVDMETFAAAKVAEQYAVPWLAVRVITDGVADDMPLDFNTLVDVDGNVDKKRVIAATVAHPWKIPALIRLGARSSLASKNLARFLEAYLPLLSDVNT